MKINNRTVSLQERQKKLRALLVSKNIDSLFITDPCNISYVTGYMGSDAWLLFTHNHAVLYTDLRNSQRAEMEVYGVTISIIDETHAMYWLLKQDIADFGLSHKTVGIEPNTISLDTYNKLRRTIESKIALTDGIIEGLRAIKDAYEITAIKAAAAISVRAFNKVFNWISREPFFSAVDIQKNIELFMCEEGAQKTSFSTIVAAGGKTALPHPPYPDKKKINSGIILIDFGAYLNGYSSDLTRSFFFGKLTQKDRKLSDFYAIVYEAQLRAIDSVRPGIHAKEVDGVARRFIESTGCGSYFTHALGHGIGLAVHELPRISKKSETVLQEGMVFSIEPGIYMETIGGVRLEDMVLVTKKGCEVLTKDALKEQFIQ
ncbi:M24 family metallopeptidase [Chlamydiota bacterium]